MDRATWLRLADRLLPGWPWPLGTGGTCCSEISFRLSCNEGPGAGGWRRVDHLGSGGELLAGCKGFSTSAPMGLSFGNQEGTERKSCFPKSSGS